MRFHPLTSIVSVLACLLLTSCRSENRVAAPPAKSESRAESAAEPASSRGLVVSIAASTQEVMEALATAFSKQHQVSIKLNPGPSSGLANQILEGAPADLFLSANRQWADKVHAVGLADSVKPLLTNKLVIVVPKGNPGEVKEPKDLAHEKVKKIALAGEKVPAGIYADQALTKLGLLDGLTKAGKIARGQDVRSALSYVERGEAEAGIVYSTDVGTASHVEQVHEFAPELHDEIAYVLVLLKYGAENSVARQFFEYMQTSEANDICVKAGFQRLPNP